MNSLEDNELLVNIYQSTDTAQIEENFDPVLEIVLFDCIFSYKCEESPSESKNI